MKIEATRPPNFDQIVAAFPDAVNGGVIFAYGDTIYNPSGNQLPACLIAHETDHLQRQEGLGPEKWWSYYISDVVFRYDMELTAHVQEYVAQVAEILPDRNYQALILLRTARRLIAPLYEYPKDYTLQRAMRDISRLLR